MKTCLNQLASLFQQSVKASLFGSMSYLQHLLMRAAVATSLKLCLFTARTLLSSTPKQRAGQSF